VYEPKPRLFAGGNPRDRQTGGRGTSVAAVVILVLVAGATSLYSLFVLPYASDNCDDSDRRLICTATGQHVVALVPLATAAVGIAIAVYSLSLRPRFQTLGITLGYVIAFGGLVVALYIAFR
jgi:hypothetical protein